MLSSQAEASVRAAYPPRVVGLPPSSAGSASLVSTRVAALPICLGGEGLRNSRQRILVFSRGRASISGEVEAAKCRRLARVLTARPRSPERSCQPQRSKSTSGLFATALLAGSHQRLARIRAVRPRSPRSRRRLRLRPPPFGCSSPSPQAGAAIAAISAEASAGSASPLPLHRASPSRRVRPSVGPIVGPPCPRS